MICSKQQDHKVYFFAGIAKTVLNVIGLAFVLVCMKSREVKEHNATFVVMVTLLMPLLVKMFAVAATGREMMAEFRTNWWLAVTKGEHRLNEMTFTRCMNFLAKEYMAIENINHKRARAMKKEFTRRFDDGKLLGLIIKNAEFGQFLNESAAVHYGIVRA